MKKVIKSMSIAIFAQVVSLALSLFVSFYISKYMGIEEYGYYQLFLFYSTYIGILQFGASEGVYLMYGGKTYAEIDKERIIMLFENIFIIQIFLGILIGSLIHISEMNSEKKFIFLILLIYMIVNFCITYFGYLLQAINRIVKYSTSIIIGKIFIFLVFIILASNHIFGYKLYCMFYLAGYVITAIVILCNSKTLFLKKIKIMFVVFKEKALLISGCSLLFSGLVSSFIVGINRIYIEDCFGIAVFGKVSMALSLSNFVIVFAIQIGLVIFPNIANQSTDKKIKIYYILEYAMGYLLFVIYMVYIPAKIFLNIWIPQYIESIQWLLILMPYVIYEIKNQILYNTYMKVMRYEKYLFKTNIISLCICAVINLFMVYQIKNIIGVFVVLDLINMGKSIVLSRKICSEFAIRNRCKNLVDACNATIMSILYYYCNIQYCIIWTAIICVFYIIYHRIYIYSKKKEYCLSIRKNHDNTKF